MAKRKIKRSNITLGDCLEELDNYADNTFDHCITDPPYNISDYEGKRKIGWLSSNKFWKEEKNFNKIKESWDVYTNKEYELFTYEWLDKIKRVVKKNGNILIFGSMHNIYLIGYLLNKSNLRIINSIIWFKPNAFPNITHRMFCESTEQIIWAVNNSQKKAKNWVFNYSKIKELNEVKRCNKCKKNFSVKFTVCPFCGNKKLKKKTIQMRNMFKIPVTSNRDKIHGKHPAQKPLELLSKIIVACTNKNDFVLDPFMGVGSIPLACKLLKRKYFGIEQNKNYFNIGKTRLKNYKSYQK